MRKSILVLLFIYLSIAVVAQNRKDIIVEYKPVQSNIVGKTIVSYSNGQALFSTKIPHLKTQDEASSSEDSKELDRKFGLSILEVLKISNVKSVTAKAYAVQVSNVNNPADSIPRGSRIVMSGLKADSVIVTIVKGNKYNLTLHQLLDKIKKFAPVSEVNPLNVLSLLDSVNYKRNKSIKFVIRNPNVVYAFIAGQVSVQYADNAYLDIKNQLSNPVLESNDITEGVLPKYSEDFRKVGFAKSFKLRTGLDESGQQQIYVQATKQEGGVEEQIVQKIGNKWFPTHLLFKSIVLGKVTKYYYVDIKAHLADDSKSIVIDSGEIRYPEWVFKAIERRNL